MSRDFISNNNFHFILAFPPCKANLKQNSKYIGFYFNVKFTLTISYAFS